MSNIQNKADMLKIEDTLRKRYSLFSIIFLIISFILIILIAIVYAGVAFLEYGQDWAVLNLEGWIIVVSALFCLFIILELIFFVHYSSHKTKKTEIQKPKSEFYQGKKLHVYTYPEGKEGGIFSKTYIEIDEKNILRLRSLMIPPEDLWKKKG